MILYIEDALSSAALIMSAFMLIVAGLSYARTRHGKVILPAVAASLILAVSFAQVFLSLGSDAPPGCYDLPVALAETCAIAAVYAIWLLRGRSGE
jgi:hypothetical protein